jgi:hypothetical protein
VSRSVAEVTPLLFSDAGAKQEAFAVSFPFGKTRIPTQQGGLRGFEVYA